MASVWLDDVSVEVGEDWPLPERLVRRVLRIVLRWTEAEEVTAALAVGGHPFMCVTEAGPDFAGLDPDGLLYMALPVMIDDRCIGSLGIRFAAGSAHQSREGVLDRVAKVLGRLVCLREEP